MSEYNDDDLVRDLRNLFQGHALPAVFKILQDRFTNDLVQTNSANPEQLVEAKRKLEALNSLIDEMRQIITTQSLKERNNDRRNSIA